MRCRGCKSLFVNSSSVDPDTATPDTGTPVKGTGKDVKLKSSPSLEITLKKSNAKS